METEEVVTKRKPKRKEKKKIKSFFSYQTKLRLGIIGAILSIAIALLGAPKAYKSFIAPDISGSWYLTLKVESSSYHAYVGDVIGIRASFSQKENGVAGTGEKWDYRGQRLPYDQHRKLEFGKHKRKGIQNEL